MELLPRASRWENTVPCPLQVTDILCLLAPFLHLPSQQCPIFLHLLQPSFPQTLKAPGDGIGPTWIIQATLLQGQLASNPNSTCQLNSPLEYRHRLRGVAHGRHSACHKLSLQIPAYSPRTTAPPRSSRMPKLFTYKCEGPLSYPVT